MNEETNIETPSERPSSAPAGSGLWCVHIQGPDEVHAFPSKEVCEQVARQISEWHADDCRRRGMDPTDVMFVPVVAPWPHDAASHAADIEQSRKLWNFNS